MIRFTAVLLVWVRAFGNIRHDAVPTISTFDSVAYVGYLAWCLFCIGGLLLWQCGR